MSKTNGNGTNGNSHKNARALTPKAATIAKQKEIFLSELKKNGGIVSKAREKSGLARRTAYTHRDNDPAFAEAWEESLEVAVDGLWEEAVKRATTGTKVVTKDNRGKLHVHYEKSDTMLIFLIKQSDVKKKWRERIVKTGNAALKAVRTAGPRLNLTEDQIIGLQDELMLGFKSIALD